MDATRHRLFSPWDLLPLAALGGAWLWLQHWMPLLPERIPSHWNAAGVVDSWMDKHASFSVAAWPSAGLWLLFVLFSLPLQGETPGKILGTKALVALRAFLPTGFIALMGFCAPLAGLYGGKAIGWGVGVMGLSLVLALIPVIRLSRLAPPIEGSRDSDYRCGGLLYWNAADPRLFVPKRIGIGLTFNFGRPMAWVLMTALLAPVGIVLVMLAMR